MTHLACVISANDAKTRYNPSINNLEHVWKVNDTSSFVGLFFTSMIFYCRSLSVEWSVQWFRHIHNRFVFIAISKRKRNHFEILIRFEMSNYFSFSSLNELERQNNKPPFSLRMEIYSFNSQSGPRQETFYACLLVDTDCDIKNYDNTDSLYPLIFSFTEETNAISIYLSFLRKKIFL